VYLSINTNLPPIEGLSRKQCKIGGYLVLITNRKSRMSFRLVQKSVTLNDLEWRNGQTAAKIMSIFRFFKMAAAAILDFQILEILTPERSIWPNCINVRQISSKSVTCKKTKNSQNCIESVIAMATQNNLTIS